jgi:hypothetical protein
VTPSPECPRCDSLTWNRCTWCSVCESACCDDCAIYAPSTNQLVCYSCVAKPELAYWVLPQFEDEFPDDPLTVEEYRRVLGCRTVAEVRQVFSRLDGEAGAKVVQMPQWHEKPAAQMSDAELLQVLAEERWDADNWKAQANEARVEIEKRKRRAA